MSDDLFHCVLLQDGCQCRPVPLLSKDGLRMDGESRFLVAAGYVLDEQTPSTLSELRDRAARRETVVITSARGTVTLAPSRVEVCGKGLEPAGAPTARFVDLVDGWRAMLLDVLAADLRGDSGRDLDPDGTDDGEHRDVDTLTIRARREVLSVWLLTDGSVTDSLDEAAADAGRDPARHDADRQRLLGELLSLPTTFGPPTPSRVVAIRELEASNLLPTPIAQDLIRSGRISDVEWRLLHELRALDEPVPVKVNRWAITVVYGEVSVDGPPGYEALHDGIGASPVDTLRWMVDQLVADGWEPVDLSSLDGPDSDLDEPRLWVELQRPRVPYQPPWA